MVKNGIMTLKHFQFKYMANNKPLNGLRKETNLLVI